MRFSGNARVRGIEKEVIEWQSLNAANAGRQKRAGASRRPVQSAEAKALCRNHEPLPEDMIFIRVFDFDFL